MAMKTARININGLCRTHQLWTGKISAGPVLGEDGPLDGVKPSTWQEQSSEIVERSVLINEGSSWRNIPLDVFNILQASETEPERVKEIIHGEVSDVERKFDLDGIETGTRDWYIELVNALVYLSADKHEDYGERYWYHPWQKAKERNPELLGEGREVLHPGRHAEPEEESGNESEANSAAEATW